MARAVEKTLQLVIEHDKTDLDRLIDSLAPALYAKLKTGETKFHEWS
jgi:hypothetical protein